MRGSGTGLGLVIGATLGFLLAVLVLPPAVFPVGIIAGGGVGLAFGAAWDTRLEDPPRDED